MNFSQYSNRDKKLIFGVFGIGFIFILLSVIISPSFLSNFRKPLSELALVKLFILQIFSAMLGFILVGFGLLKFTKNKSAINVENYIINRVFPNIKKPKSIIRIIFVILAFISFIRVVNLASNDNWKDTTGHEYYWIAQSIASGHGFSFSADKRWLFIDFETNYSKDEFFPTAWEEPIYPYYIAFTMQNFGDYAPLIILASHIVALFLTLIVIYLISKQIFDSHLGIVSVLILFFGWSEVRVLSETTFSPVVFAGLALSFSAYLFLRFIENYSLKRAVILGVFLGFTSLTVAAGILFIAIIIVLTIIYQRGSFISLQRALIIFFTFLLILSPWIVRNYLEFGEIILVRNGVGQGLHMSNLMVASTYKDGEYAYEDSLGKIWRAEGAWQALTQISTVTEKRMEIYKRAYNVISLEAPDNFDQFNEAQRDKFYLSRSVEFIVSNPGEFLILTVNRLKLFIKGWNKKHFIVSILSILSLFIWWKNPKFLFVAFLSSGYIFTFSIIGAWFYRYRYPIEPLLFMISSGLIIFIYNKVRHKFVVNQSIRKANNI